MDKSNFYIQEAGILSAHIHLMMMDDTLPVSSAKGLAESLSKLENEYETIHEETRSQIEKLNLYIQKHDAKK